MCFPQQGDARGAFEKTEREGRGEGEGVALVGSAAREAHGDSLFQRGTGGNERKVNAGFERGAFAPGHRFDAGGKRGHEPFAVAHVEASGRGTGGGNVLGNNEIQLEPGQAEPADEARNQQRGHHSGDDEEQRIIAREDSRRADRKNGGGEEHSAAGDFVADAAGDGLAQAGNGAREYHGAVRLHGLATVERSPSGSPRYFWRKQAANNLAALRFGKFGNNAHFARLEDLPQHVGDCGADRAGVRAEHRASRPHSPRWPLP